MNKQQLLIGVPEPLIRNVPAFCTHFSGPQRTQMSNRQGADARRDATCGHIVRFQGPGAAALDQETPGRLDASGSIDPMCRYSGGDSSFVRIG